MTRSEQIEVFLVSLGAEPCGTTGDWFGKIPISERCFSLSGHLWVIRVCNDAVVEVFRLDPLLCAGDEHDTDESALLQWIFGEIRKASQ